MKQHSKLSNPTHESNHSSEFRVVMFNGKQLVFFSDFFDGQVHKVHLLKCWNVNRKPTISPNNGHLVIASQCHEEKMEAEKMQLLELIIRRS